MSNAEIDRTDQLRNVPRWGQVRPAVFAVAALACTLCGCPGGVSGTAGDEGTVNLSRAEDAAKSNPALSKAAARRFGGGMRGSPIKSK